MKDNLAHTTTARVSQSRHFLTAAILLTAALPLLGQTAHKEEFEGWRQTETEHFRFIYEPRDEDTARLFLNEAEEIYQTVTDIFDYRPDQITCIIRGRYDVANGSYAGLPDRIQLFTSSPLLPLMGARTESWARLLLTHELTHYIHLTHPDGLFGWAGRLFGSSLTASQSFFLPGWMVEGITTNTETRFTQGGRGRNPYFEAPYKALVMEGEFFSRRQAEYGSPFPPDGRIYTAGYILVKYLRETYGEDVFADIHRRFIRFPFLGPYPAVKKITGDSYADIFQGLHYQLLKQYGYHPELADEERLSPPSEGRFSLPISTRQGLLLYRRTVDRAPALVLADPQTLKEKERLPVSLSDHRSFTASRDGARIYYTRFSSDPSTPAGQEVLSDLYLWTPETGKTRRITRRKHLVQPAVSSTGRLAAVQRQGSFSRLVEVDPETGEVTPLFEEDQTAVKTPDWSPDGRWLAFAVNRRGQQDIQLLDMSGRNDTAGDDTAGKSTPVFAAGPDPAPQWFPRFGEDGALYYAEQESGNGSLRLLRWFPEEQIREEVLQDPVGVLQGYQEGDRILYSTCRADGHVLRQIPLDDIVPREIQPAPQRIRPALRKRQPNQTLPRTAPPSAELSSEEEPLDSRSYTDWPRPLFWLPIPGLRMEQPPGADAASLEAGAGLFALGASFLGSSSWETLALWYPRSEQLTAQVSLQHNRGRFSTTLEGTQDFWGISDDGEPDTLESWKQSSRISLTETVRLFTYQGTNRSTAAALSGGAAWIHTTTAGTPFSFLDSFQGSLPAARAQKLQATGVLGFGSRQAAPARQLYGGNDTQLSIRINQTLPLLDSPGGETALSLQGSQGIRLGPTLLQASLRSKGSTRRDASTTAVPRGYQGILSIPAETPLWMTPSLDWLIPLALPDLPLLWTGLHLDGIGMGFHAEGTGGLAGPAGEEEILWDPAVYTGAEITLILGYSYFASLPLTLGFNTRIPLDNPREAARPANTQPYIALSLQSALDGARGIHYNKARTISKNRKPYPQEVFDEPVRP